MTEPEPLRDTCDCGKRVRVLWSGPLSENSRPVLLVCREGLCSFRQLIPESAIASLPIEELEPRGAKYRYRVTIHQERVYSAEIAADSSEGAARALGDMVRASAIEPDSAIIINVRARYLGDVDPQP